MRSVAFLVVLSLSFGISQADEWPQFLGKHRNGISSETGLLSTWPDGGPKEVWRTKCVGGLSGIVVANGHAFTMTQSGGEQAVVAIRAKDGKQIWRTPVLAAYKNQMGNGPRATPAVVGDAVFAFTGDGLLVKLNSATGKLVWQANTMKDSGGKPAEYGNASSPLVVGDLVVVIAGGPKGCLVAYSTKTGKQAWSSGSDMAGYSSPVLATFGKKKQVVAFTGSRVCGVDPANGKELWHYAFKTDYECNTANPVCFDNHVLISAGENHGATLLKVNGNKVAEVWKTLGRESIMRAEWQTPILHEGHFYVFDNIGGAGPITNLSCVNAGTGELVWREKRYGKGNAVLADGKLFVTMFRGQFAVVDASPKAFNQLGKKLVCKGTRQAPAISNGHLFLRDESEMVCLKISK